MPSVRLLFVIYIITLSNSIASPIPHSQTCSQDDISCFQENWSLNAQNELKKALNKKKQTGMARNIVMFLGDGMGPSTVTTARIYKSQTRNIRYSESSMDWELWPYTAISKTYNTDIHTPDSAGTATAFLCGEKAPRKIIGLGQHAVKGKCATAGPENQLKSILKHAQDAGMWTGIVTTARVTHATPSAAYAQSAHRDWESDYDIPESERACKDIAHQLVYSDYGKNIRVIMGGGRRSFFPEGHDDPEGGDPGRRLDGELLVDKWKEFKKAKGVNDDKISYVQNLAEFNEVNAEKVEYLLGLFEPSHMQYEHERVNHTGIWKEPSITEMTEKAIHILNRNEKGFFLLVEGGRIDHAHHNNLAVSAANETVAMSDAVAKAVEILGDDQDTMLVVTADHSHVYTLNGYPSIQSDIFGLEDSQDGDDGLPYPSVSYYSGPGNEYHRGESNPNYPHRRNLTEDHNSGKMGSPTYEYDAAVLLDSETHGGEDVAIYSTGPMSHLFTGVKQQNYIPHAMMYAACIGPNKEICNGKRDFTNTAAIFSGNAYLVVIVYVLFSYIVY